MGTGTQQSQSKRRKENKIKQHKQEISKMRRKGIINNIGLIIGKSLVSQNKNMKELSEISRPKIDKNLKKLEDMLSRQITKFKIPNEFSTKDTNSEVKLKLKF